MLHKATHVTPKLQLIEADGSVNPLTPEDAEHLVLADQPSEVVLAARLKLEARIALCVLLQVGGDEDLTGLRVGGDPGRENDVSAHQVIRISDYESGVQADAESHVLTVIVLGSGERALQFQGRVEAAVSTVERGKEAISLESGDLSVMMGDEPLDEQVVVAEELLPALGTESRSHRVGVGDVT